MGCLYWQHWVSLSPWLFLRRMCQEVGAVELSGIPGGCSWHGQTSMFAEDQHCNMRVDSYFHGSSNVGEILGGTSGVLQM